MVSYLLADFAEVGHGPFYLLQLMMNIGQVQNKQSCTVDHSGRSVAGHRVLALRAK